MSQDDSGIIFSTILHSVPTSIPYVPSLGKGSTGNEAGAATPINFASSQTASRNSIEAGSSYNAILITNATSIGASLCVIAAYYLLRRKHARLMKRTTLKLSLAMAMTDLVFHVSSNVPKYNRGAKRRYRRLTSLDTVIYRLGSSVRSSEGGSSLRQPCCRCSMLLPSLSICSSCSCTIEHLVMINRSGFWAFPQSLHS